MERQNSAKSRKSKTLRSISRSLILCNAKNSDEGSSPDERCPNPFDSPASWGHEQTGPCPQLQLACTSSTDPDPPDPLMIAGVMQLRAAPADIAKNMKRKFFVKVSGSPAIRDSQVSYQIPQLNMGTSPTHRSFRYGVFLHASLSVFIYSTFPLCFHCALRSWWFCIDPPPPTFSTRFAFPPLFS